MKEEVKEEIKTGKKKRKRKKNKNAKKVDTDEAFLNQIIAANAKTDVTPQSNDQKHVLKLDRL